MAHYFSEKQDSRLNLKKIKISLRRASFELYTGSGVFSKDMLDTGTKVLIENCIIENNWEILDLGCGIGTVGIAIKKMHPKTKVIMADVNERAVMLCKK